MSKSNEAGLGKLPPKYNFVFTPYPDQRMTRCSFCGEKTGQRNLPLFIHIKPKHFTVMNFTCRYCAACDLLIVHKHEFEHVLTEMFKQRDPTVIGNDYFVVGTVEKEAWRAGMRDQNAMTMAELPEHLHDFKTYYEELRLTQAGWFSEDQEPPLMEPPPSEEWVRSDQSGGKR